MGLWGMGYVLCEKIKNGIMGYDKGTTMQE